MLHKPLVFQFQSQLHYKPYSQKCSANPITVTPIWKWETANKEHPIRGLYMTFLKNFFSNFRSHIKDSKWGRKCILINCTSCNGSPQKIPFQFANGKLPHSRCRGFWAMTCDACAEGQTDVKFETVILI